MPDLVDALTGMPNAGGVPAEQYAYAAHLAEKIEATKVALSSFGFDDEDDTNRLIGAVLERGPLQGLTADAALDRLVDAAARDPEGVRRVLRSAR